MKNLKISIFVMISLFFSSSLFSQDLSVVVNGDAGVTKVSLKDLKDIFKSKKKLWDNGKKVKIAIIEPTSELGIKISDTLLGMTPKKIKKFWLALVFQGKAAAPKYFDNAKDLVSYVNSTNGAIGIVNADGVENGTVLKVDGKQKF